MYEDLIFSVASVVVLALATGAWLLSRHLRDAKLVRLREMAHRERIVSLERGLESAVPRPEDFELEPRRPFPVERAVLGTGIVLTCGGLGQMAAFRMIPRTPEMAGMQELWALGLIPAALGVGFLLYAWISRERQP
jgi:hypothetical protein